MSDDYVARQSIAIDAPVSEVWNALLSPDSIRLYMFGAEVDTDWRPGSEITWRGEWQGKEFEDRGKVLKVDPERLIQYSHYSPMSGLPDAPESYHTVTVELSERDAGTVVSLSQENNPTEEARRHSEENWGAMLNEMKRVVESRRQP